MLVQGVVSSAIVLIVSSIVLSLFSSRLRSRHGSFSKLAPLRPRPALAYFGLSGKVMFSVLYVGYLFHVLGRTRIGWSAIGLLAFKTIVEIGASFYGLAFLFGSIFYLVTKEKRRTGTALVTHPAVGVI